VTVTIAIDGPAAAGKGTLARRLAAALDLPYLDTGLLYRAVARRVLDADADPADSDSAESAARGLQAVDLARDDLRGPVADAAASKVAGHPAVRAALMDFQRGFAAEGAILDGRDIGTVILPNARVKLFVVADVDARAERRWREMQDRGADVPLEQVAADLARRDAQDAERLAAPLRQAGDAIVLDTTHLDADAAFARALEIVRNRLGSA
jgi:cytidylate kinase